MDLGKIFSQLSSFQNARIYSIIFGNCLTIESHGTNRDPMWFDVTSIVSTQKIEQQCSNNKIMFSFSLFKVSFVYFSLGCHRWFGFYRMTSWNCTRRVATWARITMTFLACCDGCHYIENADMSCTLGYWGWMAVNIQSGAPVYDS